MTRPTARLSRRFVPSVLILSLAGCSGLLGGGEPVHLYRLTPKSTYPPNLPHRSVQLLINEPFAPAGLDKSRIALSRSPVSIDYFADSEWTDRAPLLVQTAILPVLREQQGDHCDRPGIGRIASGLHPRSRNSSLRGRVRLRPMGRPKSGSRSISGSSTPPRAMSSRKPCSSGASALRPMTFRASYRHSMRRSAG